MTSLALGMAVVSANLRGGADAPQLPAPTPPLFVGAIADINYTAGEAMVPVDVSAEYSGAITSFAAVGAWPAGIGVGAGDGIISGTSAVEGVAGGLQVEAIGPGGSALSDVFSATGAIASGQARNFLTFGGSNYGAFDQISCSGDFSVKVAFSTTITGIEYLLGQESSAANYIAISPTEVKIRVSWGALTRSISGLNDGMLHELEIKRSGTVIDYLVDGVSIGTSNKSTALSLSAVGRSGSNYFTGVIADVELDNNGTVTRWDIDSGDINTEPPLVGVGDLAFVNVAADDWEEFVLDGGEWLSADYVGELYGNSGDAIDDTDFFKLGEADYYIQNVSGGLRTKDADKDINEGHRYKWGVDFHEQGGAGALSLRIHSDVIRTTIPGQYSGYCVASPAWGGCNITNAAWQAGAGHYIKFRFCTVLRVLEIAS
ncbi:MAG: hypothetical protein ABW168_00445 [Sedimenticola sp.]